jgi:pyruvate formate lyase activating enzyme
VATNGFFQARHWHRLPDGRVQCDLCPRFCRLREGQRGFCFVRACRDHAVVLTTYGRASGFCIDPIEKKPLFHFLPGTPVLSFGTAGCNLGCRFCQNPDLSKAREMDVLMEEATPQQIAQAAVDHGCASVAFTYNDPVIFHEYAIDAAQACHAQNIRTVAVTNGTVCARPRAEFYAHIDAANIDLKAFKENFYRRICASSLAPVLDTLQYVRHETDTWLEITTLLIPGLNDSDEEIDAMTRWVVEELGPDVPMHFTAFHPAWRMLDTPRTPVTTLRRARTIAIRNGVRYAYTGNVRDPEGECTKCHVCGSTLIARDGYVLTLWNVSKEGTCRDCGVRLAGVFNGRPSLWEGRRFPVRMRNNGA